MGFIYKINFPNGKCYIGQTRVSVENRLKGHLKKSSGCIMVSRALHKYKEEYTCEILEEIEDKFLNEREIYYISYYHSLEPNGYNYTEGGEGGSPSPETRKKISQRKKENPTIISQETREKMRKSLGSEEFRFKMSQKHRSGKSKDLPMYIHKLDSKWHSGYRIRIPGFPEKCFESKKMTDEEKLSLAIQYIDNMKNVQRLNI